MEVIGGGGSCIASLDKNGNSRGTVWIVISDAYDDDKWKVFCDSMIDQNVTAKATVYCLYQKATVWNK